MRIAIQLRVTAVVTALLLQAGCLAGRQSAAGLPAPDVASRTPTQAHSKASVVAEAELRGSEPGANVLQLLRRLRPEFLARHTYPKPGDPEDGYAVVYIDGILQGGLNTLQSIPVSFITEIRYLRATAAAEWVGRTHAGGVIAVSTYR